MIGGTGDVAALPIKSAEVCGHYTATKVAYLHGLYPLCLFRPKYAFT